MPRHTDNKYVRSSVLQARAKVNAALNLEVEKHKKEIENIFSGYEELLSDAYLCLTADYTGAGDVVFALRGKSVCLKKIYDLIGDRLLPETSLIDADLSVYYHALHTKAEEEAEEAH